jgi:hypothetical protein
MCIDDTDLIVGSEHYDIYEGTRAITQPGYKMDKTVKLFAIHNEYECLALVFARNEQDAFDDAADDGKLDSMKLAELTITSNEYGEETGENGCQVVRLGNASEAFDMNNVGIVEIPMPKFSLAGLLFAQAVDAAPHLQGTFTYYKSFGGWDNK